MATMRIPSWVRRGRVWVTAAAVACLLSGCVLGATGSPHLVTDTSAKLTGTLVSDSSDQPDQVAYWFEYGPTSNYGSETVHTGNVDVVNRGRSFFNIR